MTTAVQHRRGTTAEHASFTGLEGEVTIDTTKDTAVIHDGTLAGGYPLAKENLANVTTSGLSSIDGASTASDDKFFIYDQSATTLKTITRAELNNAIEQDALANVAITGGTINGTTIGGSTAAAGSFTTLSASSTVTLSGGTANGVLYLNGSKVATSGSALTFDGTNFGVGASPISGVKGYFANQSGSAVLRVDCASGGNTSEVAFGAYGFSAVAGVKFDDANTLLNIYALSTRPITFSTNGSEAMRLTSTGLGIGTSSPSEKLTVQGAPTTYGDARFNASLFDTTSATTGTGSGIAFSGYTNGTSTGATFAQIKGIKENSTAGNVAGAFVISTQPASGTPTERLRIDSSGNLGLGVTPSAWAPPFGSGVFELSGAYLAGSASNGIVRFGQNHYYNGSSYIYKANGLASAFLQNSGAFQFFTAPSGTAGDAITFTQAMTLDASGQLGIGSTSPAAFVDVLKASYVDQYWRTGTVSMYVAASNSSAIGIFGTTTNHPLTFYTNGGEKARIDSSGNLLVGTTSSSGKITVYTSGGVVGQSIQVYEVAPTIMQFKNSQDLGGSITIASGGSTSYNTSSDYRLKNSIAPMTGALAKVALLKPCTYRWNANNAEGEGFIAHELAEVCPHAVTGEKDAVDENGNPKYQGIDVSFLVATLTAAIQELKAEFDAYKASHP